MIKNLKQHKFALVGFWVLLFFYGCAFFASFLAPYSLDDERRDHSYHPLTRLHFVDAQGNFSLRPCVYETGYEFDSFYQRQFFEKKSAPTHFIFLLKERISDGICLGLTRPRAFIYSEPIPEGEIFFPEFYTARGFLCRSGFWEPLSRL